MALMQNTRNPPPVTGGKVVTAKRLEHAASARRQQKISAASGLTSPSTPAKRPAKDLPDQTITKRHDTNVSAKDRKEEHVRGRATRSGRLVHGPIYPTTEPSYFDSDWDGTPEAAALLINAGEDSGTTPDASFASADNPFSGIDLHLEDASDSDGCDEYDSDADDEDVDGSEEFLTDDILQSHDNEGVKRHEGAGSSPTSVTSTSFVRPQSPNMQASPTTSAHQPFLDLFQQVLNRDDTLEVLRDGFFDGASVLDLNTIVQSLGVQWPRELKAVLRTGKKPSGSWFLNIDAEQFGHLQDLWAVYGVLLSKGQGSGKSYRFYVGSATNLELRFARRSYKYNSVRRLLEKYLEPRHETAASISKAMSVTARTVQAVLEGWMFDKASPLIALSIPMPKQLIVAKAFIITIETSSQRTVVCILNHVLRPLTQPLTQP